MSAEHYSMDPEQRHRELRLILAARDLVMTDSHGDTSRVYAAVKELAEYHGSDTHLLADLDAELDEYAIVPKEPALEWVLRTWHDVRRGDTVRIPGTEHTAVIEHRYWPPQPMRNPMDLKAPQDPQMDVRAATAWHVVPGADGHWGDHVVKVRPDGKPECVVVFAGETQVRFCDPLKPVEIQMDARTAALLADEHWSWEERY